MAESPATPPPKNKWSNGRCVVIYCYCSELQCAFVCFKRLIKNDSNENQAESRLIEKHQTQTYDEDLCWGNLSSSCYLTSKKPTKQVCSLDDGLVTCDVRHGAEGIERLGPTDARNAVNRECRELMLCQSIDEVFVLGRVHEADNVRPFFHQLCFMFAKGGVNLWSSNLSIWNSYF